VVTGGRVRSRQGPFKFPIVAQSPMKARQARLSPAPGTQDSLPPKPNPGASMSPRPRARPARAAGRRRRAAGPAPIVFELSLVAMPSPRSLWPPCRPSIASFDGARQAARHQGRSTSARRSARRREPRPAAGAPSATGACAREGRAIPWRQLPRMRSAPIEACCKADGLRFVLDVT
jgi:hypothetical protein